MKRFLLFTAMLFMSLGVFAQRAAVMDFKAGAGISQADVDGISGIFITYFRPIGYTMVERTQIDRVIDEQGFQRSRLTESQMVRIGQILNVSKIVIGDVNVVMGQYNVDVRVINVESGTIAATEGATFSGSSYRTTMQTLAQKLAGKIALSAGPTVSASSASSSSSSARTRSSVETVYGYLHVFPNELGVFQSAPTNVIANINAQKMHGYNDWRLPTNEELSLLLANGYLSGAQYMSKDKSAGMVLLVTTGKSVVEKEAIEAEKQRQAELKRQAELERQRQEKLNRERYIDLGLPSGTLWRNGNEGGGYVGSTYTYKDAIEYFGSNLPTISHWRELLSHCKWKRIDDGRAYQVTGPNGNYITLPARPGYSYTGHFSSYNYGGHYLSSTWRGTSSIYILGFDKNSGYGGKLEIDDVHPDSEHLVRLIKSK